MGPILQSVRDLFAAGGWAMWPLLALSLLGAALSVERLLFWITTDRPGRRRFLQQLTSRLRSGDAPGARALIARDGSVYARVAEGLLDRTPSDAAALELVESVRPVIDRFTTTLSTIITAAPLLGILGTVTGIIESFQLLGASGSESAVNVADPAQVASGIAEALVTTAFGLLVATAVLFPFAWARGAAERCLGRLETLAAAAMQGRERVKPNRNDARD